MCTRNNQALSESVFTKVQTSRFPQISWLSYCVTFSRNAVHDELGDAWHWAVTFDQPNCAAQLLAGRQTTTERHCEVTKPIATLGCWLSP